MNAKLSNKIKIGIVLVVVALLVLSGIFVYYYVIEDKEDDKEEEPEEFEYDFRINPYNNQGLIVEVLRIRNRDLMDRMLSFGTSWKDTPSFYWDLKVDEKEATTKEYIGTVGVYNTWDTITKETCITTYIEDGQEKSDVTITIMEEVKSGLLGRKTTDVEKETIHLTFDYYTGRWTGDDSFKDSDGYGHYLGENYEVWFNLYQDDYDHDNIPYWVEVNILRTNPTIDDSILDPDNDGIPTSWEWKWDYDPSVWNDHQNLDPDIDGLNNIEEYQMRKYFSNPYQPDVYIETDGMQDDQLIELDHVFYKESQQMIIERFAQHGINVYIDDGWPDGPVNGGGEMLPHYGPTSSHIKTNAFYPVSYTHLRAHET